MNLNWRRQVLLWSWIVLMVVVVRGFFFYQNLHKPLSLPAGHAEPYLAELRQGQSLTHFLGLLSEDGVLGQTQAFDLRLYARISGQASQARAGEYRIDAGMSSLDVLARLTRGDVHYHRITLVEGWTLRQAITRLQANPNIRATLDIDDEAALREFFGVEHYPEGLIYPETYSFTRGTSDRAILQQARQMLTRVLEQEWEQRAVGLPYGSPYEALVMASIIEKETGLASERAEIAGVFVRRLQEGMRLQTDPTVIYGLGERFTGTITRDNLRENTPYNTYTNHGLPPTPISGFGAASLRAAYSPADVTYRYYVLDPSCDGSHVFADTLDAHNRNVAEFRAAGGCR